MSRITLDNCKLITWILEDEGYQSVCAASAEKGLELLNQWNFDLILMDISLPGMDGKQAARIIRQTPKIRDLPIIALTAHAIAGEHELIMAAGMSDLITKPLDETKLLKRIAELYTPPP